MIVIAYTLGSEPYLFEKSYEKRKTPVRSITLNLRIGRHRGRGVRGERARQSESSSRR
jgi:hypothetical protein